MSTEKDVYEAELLKLGYGLPIYEPNPSDQYDKVRIGDVGYVDGYGFFHRAFNATLPKDHPINRQHGTPDDFVALPENASVVYHRNPLPAGAMLSTHVRLLEGCFGVSADTVQTNTRIKLSISNQQGAALVTRDPSFKASLRNAGAFRSYMLKHYRSWHMFIRDDLQRDINLQDIVLVTGCDLTADWATATFVEKVSECEIEFKANPGLIASGSVGLWGTWQSSVSVPVRCGPRSVVPPATTNPSTVVNNVRLEERENQNYNQCIFLRGFRVQERKLRAPKVIKAAAEPKDLDMDRDYDQAPVLFWPEQDSNGYESDGNGSHHDHDFSSCHSKTSIMYERVLNFILQTLNVDVAIIHDNDIYNLIAHAEKGLDCLTSDDNLRESGINTVYLGNDSRTKVGMISMPENVLEPMMQPTSLTREFEKPLQNSVSEDPDLGGTIYHYAYSG